MSAPGGSQQGDATTPRTAQSDAAPAAGQLVGSVHVPRWGYQASFIQRRQPAFWLFLLLLVITSFVVLGRELEFIQSRSTAWFFSIPLLVLYVVPLLIAIYMLDLFEREPISLLIAAFLWGGVVAIGFAGMTDTAWLQIIHKVMGPRFASDWGAAIVGPSVEETLKYLGVVMLFLVARSEFDDVFDGFVYGAVVGLGFAAVEDLHYFARLSSEADQIGGVLQLYFIRVISAGLYGHVLYTGLAGMGFAYFVSRRDQPYPRRVQIAVLAFAAAWLAHFIWNSPLLGFVTADRGVLGFFILATVKGLPMLIAFAVLVYLAQRREARWFRSITARDAGTDLLSAQEVAQLSDLRTRRAARKSVAARKGRGAERLMARLQREQINLAMVRTRVDSEDHPDLVRQRSLIRSIRAALAAVPDLPAPVAAAVMASPGPAPVGRPPVGPTTVGSAGIGPTPVRPTNVGPARVDTTRAAPATVGAVSLGATPVHPATVGPTTVDPTPVRSPSTPRASGRAEDAGPADLPLSGSGPAPRGPATPSSQGPAEPVVPAAAPIRTRPAAAVVPRATSLFARPRSAGAAEDAVATGHAVAAEDAVAAEHAVPVMPGAPGDLPGAPGDLPGAPGALPALPALPAESTSSGTDAAAAPTTLLTTAPATVRPAGLVPTPETPPSWVPTHLVPAGGMQAWGAPDPGRPPIAMLAERLDLRLIERAGDWAHVLASNDWNGWVDGRRLIAMGGAQDRGRYPRP